MPRSGGAMDHPMPPGVSQSPNEGSFDSRIPTASRPSAAYSLEIWPVLV